VHDADAAAPDLALDHETPPEPACGRRSERHQEGSSRSGKRRSLHPTGRRREGAISSANLAEPPPCCKAMPRLRMGFSAPRWEGTLGGSTAVHFSSSGLILTATDLGAFSECSHRTLLDLGVALGTHERPHGNDLERQMLERRGREHEARVLEHYRASGRSVVVITDAPTASVEAHEQAARATER